MNKNEILALVDEEDEVIVRCNNCDNYYLDEASDLNDGGHLIIMKEIEDAVLSDVNREEYERIKTNGGGPTFFKACPVCRTDAYLMDININQINDHE